MRTYRPALLAAAAAVALLVPVERAALSLMPGVTALLYAEAQAGKDGRGGRDGGKGDRGGRSGGHRDHDGKGRSEAKSKGDGDHGKDRGRRRDNDEGDKGGKKGGKQAGKGGHGKVNVPFDPESFVRRIDNPYYPLKPGTVFVYRGEDVVNKVRVTNRTKEILGVKTTVVKDVEHVDGKLAERTFDWYAQDKKGNVWYFGESTAEYEDGKVVSRAGSWKAGRKGARPGIVMLAEPEPGLTYQHEVAPGVAEDMARVESLRARVKVPYGEFNNALKTFEFTPLEPDIAENKFYVPGLGQVLSVDLEDGAREELVRIRRR